MSSDEECLVLRINVTLKYIGDSDGINRILLLSGGHMGHLK